ARVANANGCISVAEVTLDFANNPVAFPMYLACDDETNDGIIVFNLQDLTTYVLAQNNVPNTANVTFYNSQEDLENQVNALSGTYENTDTPYFDYLYVQITDNCIFYSYAFLYLLEYQIQELVKNVENSS